MTDFIAWHGKSLSEHEALRDHWAALGYRFVSLSIYGDTGPDVMTIAKSVNWDSADLFPDFGIPAL